MKMTLKCKFVYVPTNPEADEVNNTATFHNSEVFNPKTIGAACWNSDFKFEVGKTYEIEFKEVAECTN